MEFVSPGALSFRDYPFPRPEPVAQRTTHILMNTSNHALLCNEVQPVFRTVYCSSQKQATFFPTQNPCTVRLDLRHVPVGVYWFQESPPSHILLISLQAQEGSYLGSGTMKPRQANGICMKCVVTGPFSSARLATVLEIASAGY